MRILLKLHYAKFDVSSLFCSNVIEEKPLGVRLDPPPTPLVKEGLKFSRKDFDFWISLHLKEETDFIFRMFDKDMALGLT